MSAFEEEFEAAFMGVAQVLIELLRSRVGGLGFAPVPCAMQHYRVSARFCAVSESAQQKNPWRNALTVVPPRTD